MDLVCIAAPFRVSGFYRGRAVVTTTSAIATNVKAVVTTTSAIATKIKAVVTTPSVIATNIKAVVTPFNFDVDTDYLVHLSGLLLLALDFNPRWVRTQ